MKEKTAWTNIEIEKIMKFSEIIILSKGEASNNWRYQVCFATLFIFVFNCIEVVTFPLNL